MRECTNAMRPRVPASQGLPLPRPLLMGLAGRLVDLGAELRPRHQMRGRGKPGHVDPGLGDELAEVGGKPMSEVTG